MPEDEPDPTEAEIERYRLECEAEDERYDENGELTPDAMLDERYSH